MKEQNAFTLAEVLITLTIIGVIAAITIPNLMQSYKKHQVEVGVKEAYTILSNAIKMGVAESGDASDALKPYASDYTKLRGYITNGWANTYLVPYLKIDKDVTDINSSGSRKFATQKYIYPHNLKPLNSPNPTDMGEFSHQYWRQLLLKNGMFIGVAIGLGSGGSSYHVIIWVDIDGPGKGANRAGYDTFAFSYYIPSQSCQYIQYCNFGGKLNAGDAGNSYYESMIKTQGCNDTGRNCAYVIQRNGWKIPDDYPVKKF